MLGSVNVSGKEEVSAQAVFMLRFLSGVTFLSLLLFTRTVIYRMKANVCFFK